MLILNRKAGTKVIIQLPENEQVVITVLGENQYGTSLGFEAPNHIKIDREEKYIHDMKKDDNWGNK
jgi:carbon storage regulator CsrA